MRTPSFNSSLRRGVCVYSIHRRLRLGSLEKTHKQGQRAQRVLRTQRMQSIIPSSAANESHMPRLFERCLVPTTTSKHHDERGRHGRSAGNITTAPADRFKRNLHVAQRTNHKLTSTKQFLVAPLNPAINNCVWKLRKWRHARAGNRWTRFIDIITTTS